MGSAYTIQAVRIPQHFIRIPTNTSPPQRLHLIDDVLWVSAIGCQIAAMKHQVRRDLTQIGENRFEGTPVAVNVGDNCDSYPSPLLARFLIMILESGNCLSRHSSKLRL